MNLTKQVGLFGGALALSLTGGAFAGGEELNNDELKNRLLAAEAKIAELEAQNTDNWLTEQRSDEIRSLVNDVLADADTRASLLQSGMTAGYDDGFVISSSDGNWLLRVNGQLQARFVFNGRDADPTPANSVAQDKWRYGFENTRTKLIFSGHVMNPSWTYMVEGNFDGAQDATLTNAGNVATTGSESGAFTLQRAWVHWDYGNGWGVRLGQFKTRLLREFSVFSGHQLAVERSNVSYIFGTGRTQGVEVTYESDALRGWVSFNDGRNADNTAWSTYDSEFGIDARLDWLLSGTWDQMKDFTSPAGDETGIMIGGGINYTKDEYGTTGNEDPNLPGTGIPGDNERELMSLTVDGQFEFGGANLFASFIYRRDKANDSSLFPDADQFGFVVQGGFNLSDDWEIYGRWEWLDLDAPTGNDTQNILTVGVNRYFSGHNLKWTTDFQYSLDELLATNPITGLRPDPTEKNQWAIRTQLQLMF